MIQTHSTRQAEGVAMSELDSDSVVDRKVEGYVLRRKSCKLCEKSKCHWFFISVRISATSMTRNQKKKGRGKYDKKGKKRVAQFLTPTLFKTQNDTLPFLFVSSPVL
jgi:hypothetical protein